ncbi:MAG: LCP family protein [Acidimicrobiales bacterium]
MANSSGSGAQRYAHAKARPPRRTGKRVGLVLAVVVALVVVGVGGFALYGQYLLNQVHRVTVGSEAKQIAGQPLNVLLIGNNTRAGLSPKEAAQFGTAAQVGGGRADVSMIAHFDPTTKSVTLVSIPRDLFIPIPGTQTLQRVDAELNPAKGSKTEDPNRLVKTIEDDLGIPIQHYVELNFDSFQGVVNALGGVKMYFPAYLHDAYSGLNITQTGCQLLNGAQALQVVRARHLQYRFPGGSWQYDGLGDLSRTRRDHIFLKVLASQVKAAGIGNPVRDVSLLKSVLNFATIDSGFSESEMLSLLLTYRHTSVATAPTGTLPIAFENGYYYKGANYGSVVFPQEPADLQMMQSLLGYKTPLLPPSSVSVTVVNGSHSYGVQGGVASKLQALGFKANAGGISTPGGNPSETVIYYTPGHIAQAEVLKASLSGSVMMGQVSNLSVSTPLELVVGDQLGVAQKVTPAPTTTQASTSTTKAPKSNSHSSSANKTTTSVSLPNVTGATQVNVVQNPEPWDPRGC